MEVSPILIPIIAMLIPVVAIVGGTITRVQAEHARTDQRRDMLQRGIPLDEIERVMARRVHAEEEPRLPTSPTRTATNIRLTAIVLISSGLSLALFFAILGLVLHEREVYAATAVGILPLGVGLGFWVDYRARMREIFRMREAGEL